MLRISTVIIFLPVLLLSSDLYANQSKNYPFSISAHTGAFKSQEIYYRSFKEKYGSDTFLSYGVELYIPFAKRVGVMGKMTWMSATGVPIRHNRDGTITRLEEGSAELLRRYSNIGFKVNIPVIANYGIDFMGGLSHRLHNEKIRYEPNGTVSEDRESIPFGYFGGLGIEYTLENAPISLICNVQYNRAIPAIDWIIGTKGGTNLSIGMRYYITPGTKAQ